MKIKLMYKKIAAALGFALLLIGVFYVHALAGLASDPVTFAKPPEFVQKYVNERYKEQVLTANEEEAEVKLTTDYFNEAALVRNVIVNGESPDQLIDLFTHSDKAKRVKIAVAFGEVNIKLSHDEGTNFDERRKAFWQKVDTHSADIQSALFEALIASAQERTRTFIPYTLAWWMKETKPKAVEMLTWAAKHHPDPWVRRFSVYYVVQFGDNEEFAEELIDEQTHDPAFRVRKQVLELRLKRFKEMFFGAEEQ